MKKVINTWPGWECVRVINHGSFGIVYEIQRIEYGRKYTAALKVITIEATADKEETVVADAVAINQRIEYYRNIVADISKECSLMYDFKGYTNFVSYEDHMVVESIEELRWDILIRMELLQPLDLWIRNNGDTPENIARIGVDICNALEICHSRNIIHRDIKPGNIFVNATGNFKLGDFGIAKSLENDDTTMSIKGTISYMAPEIFLHQKYSFSSDIYALGIVLYRYLNRGMPVIQNIEQNHFGVTENVFGRQTSMESIPVPERGSDLLRKTVMKAVAFYPEERFDSAAEFRSALLTCPEMQGDKRFVNIDETNNKTPFIDSNRNLSRETETDLQSQKNPNWSTSKKKVNSVGIIAVIICLATVIFGLFVFLTVKREKVNTKPDGLTKEIENVNKTEAGEQETDKALTLKSKVMLSGTMMEVAFSDDGFEITDSTRLEITSTNTNTAYVHFDENLRKYVIYALAPGETEINAEYEGKTYNENLSVHADADIQYGISITPVYDSLLLHGSFSSKRNKLRFILKGCEPGDVNIVYYYDPGLSFNCVESWSDNEFIIEIENHGSRENGRMIVMATSKNNTDVIYAACEVEIEID